MKRAEKAERIRKILDELHPDSEVPVKYVTMKLKSGHQANLFPMVA